MSTIDRRGSAGESPYYGEAAMDAGYDAVYEENGWLMFAALIIVFTGIWNAIEGSIAFFHSAFFTGTPIFGGLLFWASVWIGIGILEIAVGYGIMGGRNWARWFGIVLVSINTLVHMASIPLYPWWSLFILGTNVLILFALAVRWPRRVPAVS